MTDAPQIQDHSLSMMAKSPSLSCDYDTSLHVFYSLHWYAQFVCFRWFMGKFSNYTKMEKCKNIIREYEMHQLKNLWINLREQRPEWNTQNGTERKVMRLTAVMCKNDRRSAPQVLTAYIHAQETNQCHKFSIGKICATMHPHLILNNRSQN